IVLAFVLGFGCRALGIPLPAPQMILGALLVMTMTIGYLAVDRWASSDRNGAGIRVGLRLPRTWNPVARTSNDPGRAARDDDDDRISRGGSMGIVRSEWCWHSCWASAAAHLESRCPHLK